MNKFISTSHKTLLTSGADQAAPKLARSIQSFVSSAVLLSLCSQAQAQDAGAHQEHHAGIEEVIIEASPLGKSLSGNAGAVSVLNGDELRKEAAASLGETIKNQMGVSNSTFGPGVGQPVIRGQSAGRVKVTQNNLSNMDASTTSSDHANATEALLADQVEILRGPATLRFGSGAIGGVVNVVDSRIPREAKHEITGAAETRYSSVNDGSATVFRLDGGNDLASGNNLSWHIDGLYRSSNDQQIPSLANPEDPEHSSVGFVDNTDSRAKSATAGFAWFGEQGSIGFSVSKLESNYGIPAGAHEHNEEEGHDDHEEEGHDDHEEEGHDDHEEEEEVVRIDMEQTRYDLKAELSEPLSGFEQLSFGLAYTDYQHSELEGAEVGTQFENDAWETRLELTHKEIAGWNGLVGLQLADSDFSAVGEEAFVPPSNTQNTGVYWIAEKSLDDSDYGVVLETGLRIEQQSIDADGFDGVEHDTFSASFGAHLDVAEDQHLHLILSHAQRAPNVEELYSDGAHIATATYDRGDENLSEEISWNLDVGYLWQVSSSSKLKLNVFYNQFEDYIFKRGTEVEDHESEFEIYEFTQADASFRGLEAEWSQALSDNTSLRLFGDYVRATLDEALEPGASRDLPRITPLRMGVQLETRFGEWDSSLRVTEVDDQNNPGDHEEVSEGYTLVDAELSRNFAFNDDDLLVFLRADNLLDEEVRNATSFLRGVAPEAGRGLTAGVRFSF